MTLPSPYGMILSLSLLLGFVLARRRLIQRGIAEDFVASLALLAAPAMLIGARLYHVLTDWHLYQANPISALYFWNGGFGLWGAVAGGLIVVWIYSKKEGYTPEQLLNGIAPIILSVIALGRWGNVLSGELVPFAYFDSMMSGMLFAIVSVWEKKSTYVRENIFWIVLGMYTTSRFVGEFLRSEPRLGDFLTVNQFVCLAILGITVRELYLTWSRGKNIIH